MRVLLVAPFERNLPHGGSLRATAMAERLEERGATVDWRTVRPQRVGRAAKLLDLMRLRPALPALYPQGAVGGSAPDAAIAAHSYLFPLLGSLPPAARRVIDFHNLESRHLADSAEFERPAHRPYAATQVRLMRRFERRAIAAADLSLFVSDEEREWAARGGPPDRLLLVPSVLPRGAERAALEVAAEDLVPPEPQLGYVGTLRFPPNAGALLRFLSESWPAVCEAVPNVALRIAGDSDGGLADRLARFPGVEVLGAVPDLAPLLRSSAAMLLPVAGRAGTSLRALEYSLAGVWPIGTPEAFRGIPWELGATARTPGEWANAVRAALRESAERRQRIAAAREAALAHQRDDGPWDRLVERIAA